MAKDCLLKEVRETLMKIESFVVECYICRPAPTSKTSTLQTVHSSLSLKNLANKIKKKTNSMDVHSLTLTSNDVDSLLLTELLTMFRRADPALAEFSSFYCLRLVLDKESPLATFFMDFFCQMHWFAGQMLSDPPVPASSGICRPLSEVLGDPLLYKKHKFQMNESIFTNMQIPDWFYPVKGLVHLLQQLVACLNGVMHVCRGLYAVCRLSPTASSNWLPVSEFKREMKGYRMFCKNKIHCSIRTLGFVDLDGYPDCKVDIGGEIGSGGNGVVYKGYFKTSDGTLISEKAVKMYGGKGVNQTMENNSSKSFVSLPLLDPTHEELHRLVSVQHPNVVKPNGYIRDRGDLGHSGLVMELMDQSLRDFLQEVKHGERKGLRELEVIGLALEIAKGMRFVHECGLMHRDLKPGNVLLRRVKAQVPEQSYEYEYLEVKLADFGCTKPVVTSNDGLHTAPQGTRYYMAPEVCQESNSGKTPYAEKADVFSYGTTCFNILIADPSPQIPYFNGDFYTAIRTSDWMSKVHKLYRKHQQRMGKIPYYLVELIKICWRTDPMQRPTFATICLFLNDVKQKLLSKVPIDLSFIFESHEKYITEFDCRLKTYLKSYIGDRAMEPMRSILKDFSLDAISGQLEEAIHTLRKDGLSVARKIEQGHYKKKITPEQCLILVQAFGKTHMIPTVRTLDDVVGNGVELERALFCYSTCALHTVDRLAYSISEVLTDCSMDEASCELDVDKSMIPLLVCCWAPYDILSPYHVHYCRLSIIKTCDKILDHRTIGKRFDHG